MSIIVGAYECGDWGCEIISIKNNCEFKTIRGLYKVWD